MLATFLAMWLVAVAAPATSVARTWCTAPVDRPAAWLGAVSRGHVALVALATLVVGMVVWLGEGNGVRMLAMAAPAAATWLATVEVATCLDVAIAAVAAWSAVQLRVVPASAARRGDCLRRVRTRSRTTDAANDDTPGDRRRCA